MNRPFLIQYDIPETRVGGRSRPVTENPSDEMWRAGCVRITYSCWLVMEADLQRTYLVTARLQNAGCRVYAVPFDVSGMDQLREMALSNIQREIQNYMTRAEETRAEAETRFDDESDSDYVRRRRAYLAAARSIEKRVTEMVRRVAPAAARFGISTDQLRTRGALGEVELIAANMRERAEAFAQAHNIVTRSGNTGMARQMRNAEIPADIAADYLMDRDDAESYAVGERLNNAVRASF